jgi:lipopolysaccharide biosynthesis protein
MQTISKTRIIAFYLPQFHPIPENDTWWGKGFTEWTNAAKAKPMFPGHYQPHIPADLGFYDLRVPETRIEQADMAREYGIEAFCYYHYWFAGKRLLERPFAEVLESGKPDFPFCLCWANQTWTGIWHGAPDRILIEQTYPGIEDHQTHFKVLLQAFSDSRYVTVEGKPLFLIYCWHEIPNVREVMEFWRKLAIESGLRGLYLVAVLHHRDEWVPEQYGFDGCVRTYIQPLREQWVSWKHPMKKIKGIWQQKRGVPTIYLYEKVLMNGFPKESFERADYPCLIPNWDNTPRSGSSGVVLHQSTPELFKAQVRKALELTKDLPKEHQIIFVKSWNEWAEGNHLEPDLRFGEGYLEVIRNEIYK